LKILFLNPVGNLGGAERSLLELVAIIGVHCPDWDLHLITGDQGPLLQVFNESGLNSEVMQLPSGIRTFGDSSLTGRLSWKGLVGLVTRAPVIAFQLWAYLSKLGRRIEQLQPDVIHSNGFKFHVIIGLMGRRGTKVIWHARDYISKRKLVGKVLRRLCHKPDLLVANSLSVAEDWEKCFPGLDKIVLHNCVSIPELGEYSGQAEILFGMKPSGQVRIGLVASFAKWKGQDIFLQAVKILSSKFPKDQVAFFIVGGPLYSTGGSQFSLDELKAHANVLGVLDRVVFLPHQTNVSPVYQGLDIVVHASTKPEPFGRTIVEGMAHGKAVVAALDGGVKEIISDGKDALAFTPGDPEDLARKLALLIQNSEMRSLLGKAAHDKVENSFSREALRARTMAIYDSLIGNYC
jgi:glycosyltransferase involved in cell wall biosynthesis